LVHRIYKEIGPGDRISLCKLAVDTLEETGRPLRLAIDFSIWQFQVQAAKGIFFLPNHCPLALNRS
jgi:Holliday junction resolvase YEN1